MMNTTRRLLFLFLGSTLLATCYNPQILSGGLSCGPNFKCPDGFVCSNNSCVTAGQTGATGGTGPTGGVGGTGGNVGGNSGMCTTPMDPYGPFMGCQSPPRDRGCDPVCQSGCACNERCRLEGGNTACRQQDPPFMQAYDSCDPKTDTCRPGTICLQESQDHPACGAHCYRHCRQDADCPNAKCTIDVQFGNSATSSKVCSPPMDSCNPFGPARCGNPNRPYPTFACYVMSSSYPDIPICDCAGTTPVGMTCTYEHECEPGAECVLLGMARICRRVCKVGVPLGTALALGGCPMLMPTCTAFPGGSQFGYCH